jgi:hypothetical protein
MILVEVEVHCDTLGCEASVKSRASYEGPVRTPPGWTAIFFHHRTEHHCQAHGEGVVAGYKKALPAHANSLRYEIGQEVT